MLECSWSALKRSEPFWSAFAAETLPKTPENTSKTSKHSKALQKISKRFKTFQKRFTRGRAVDCPQILITARYRTTAARYRTLPHVTARSHVAAL